MRKLKIARWIALSGGDFSDIRSFSSLKTDIFPAVDIPANALHLYRILKAELPFPAGPGQQNLSHGDFYIDTTRTRQQAQFDPARGRQIPCQDFEGQGGIDRNTGGAKDMARLTRREKPVFVRGSSEITFV